VAQVSTTALTVDTPILNIPKYTESGALSYTYPVNQDYSVIVRLTNSYIGPATDSSFA
jgi:hypothetical protein